MTSIRVRLGTIAWEVEETHNTQSELELAMEFYFPQFQEHVNSLTSETGKESTGKDYLKIKEDLKSLPSLVLKDHRFSCDAMKCLNMLGILWAGRDEVKRSFLNSN